MPGKRLLGLDVGSKRIGVAASDPDGILASAVATIHRRGPRYDMGELRQLVEEYDPALIIVGLPRTLRGEIGEQAKRVMEFAEKIQEELGIKIEYIDERMTTISADRLMREAGVKEKARREKIDAISAVLILQTFLDETPRKLI